MIIIIIDCKLPWGTKFLRDGSNFCDCFGSKKNFRKKWFHTNIHVPVFQLNVLIVALCYDHTVISLLLATCWKSQKNNYQSLPITKNRSCQTLKQPQTFSAVRSIGWGTWVALMASTRPKIGKQIIDLSFC